MPRPTLDETLIAVASTWAMRSTCSRLQVGAVLARAARARWFTSNMTTAPATGYVPTAVPEDYIVRLTDHGRWRERGITHWHLVKSDLPFVVNGRPNEDRFNPERIAAAVARAERITTDPRQALRWIYETQIAALLAGSDPAAYANQRGWHSEDVLCQHIEVTWETLTLRCGQLTPAGFGMETRQNHASDVFAYPQTAETCRRH